MAAELLYKYQKHDNSGLIWKELTSGTDIPEFAIEAGQQLTGFSVFVGRSKFSCYLKPGKLVRFDGYDEMFIAHNGLEYRQESFQILTNPNNVAISWRKSSQIPENAILGGTAYGNPLYIGRGKHFGHVVVGYVKQVTPFIWYSWGGEEYTNADYEILCADEL